jgi:hypothetical protein
MTGDVPFGFFEANWWKARAAGLTSFVEIGGFLCFGNAMRRTQAGPVVSLASGG